MLKSLMICGNCENCVSKPSGLYCDLDGVRVMATTDCKEFKPKKKAMVFPVEELIREHLSSLMWMLDYCLEKGVYQMKRKDVCPGGGCNVKYLHGGDDSVYNYIPNGLDTIKWIVNVMEHMWDHENRVDREWFTSNYRLPQIQDCVSEDIRMKILRLAVELGYPYDEIVEAGFYELEVGIDFNKVLELMMGKVDRGETEKDEWGNEFVSVYLGSVLSLFPSGKYYTPFACSNVTEDEAFMDEIFINELELRAYRNGMYLFSGEGNPTDIFVGMSVDNLNTRVKVE